MPHDTSTHVTEDILAPADGIVAVYREAFAKYGRSEEALLWSKNKQAVRFAALCRHIPNHLASCLDYGCGFGDLATWLERHRPALGYVGADVVPDFIASNTAHFPDKTFLNVTHSGDVTKPFDHIVCSGVFNLDPANNPMRHWQHIQHTIADLFGKTRISLHIDFLAHDTDFRQPMAHHQDIHTLIQFVETRITRRYVLDRTYMPYEYCISLFADGQIERPRNVYGRHVGS